MISITAMTATRTMSRWITNPMRIRIRPLLSSSVIKSWQPQLRSMNRTAAFYTTHRKRNNNKCCILQSSPLIQQHQPQIRYFARSSAPVDETPYDKAVTFVIGVGHSPEIAKGVVDALKEAGMSGDLLLKTVRQMAGRWEVGEDEGLDALVASVEQSMKMQDNKQIVKIQVLPPNAWKSSKDDDSDDSIDGKNPMLHRAFTVEVLEGTTLTDVAKFGTGKGASTLGEYIECACSGIMACSTCHVVIGSEEWFNKVGEPCEAEQDMLDLAYFPQPHSRLGCQIVITKDMEGLLVQIPASANNLMDFVPFQD